MYRKILVPTNGSALSNRGVTEASRLARALGAKLLVLHVRSPLVEPHHVEGGALSVLGEEKLSAEIEDEERKLLEAAVDIAASIGITAETAFVADLSPYEAIVRVAREAQCDVIVMASHGRRGVPGFLIGSVTQKVLTHTPTPVLVVH
jgi:nucleotide-binding universal stress UspA family protein